MKKNMGIIDRSIRVVIALAIGILYYTEVISGTLGLVLGGIAVIFLLTSVISFCPLYLPFKIKTTKQ